MRLSNYFSAASLKQRRKTWLDIHLWLGLFLVFFMAVFGLTGSILVFHAEINEWLNPELLTVAVPSNNPAYKPVADIIKAANAVMPSNAKNTFVTYPRNEEAAYRVSYTVPRDNDIAESWEIYVNPYSAEVTGKKLTGASDKPIPFTFIGFVFELHYALFLGEDPGYSIVSAMAGFLMISVLSGLILWRPMTGNG